MSKVKLGLLANVFGIFTYNWVSGFTYLAMSGDPVYIWFLLWSVGIIIFGTLLMAWFFMEQVVVVAMFLKVVIFWMGARLCPVRGNLPLGQRGCLSMNLLLVIMAIVGAVLLGKFLVIPIFSLIWGVLTGTLGLLLKAALYCATAWVIYHLAKKYL